MGINFQNVSFKYSSLASKKLIDVSFDIKSKDEFIFILGHTGSGKTTLAQHMNALLLPTAGQIKVFDKCVVTKMSRPIKLNTKKNRLKFDFENNHKMFARGYKAIYSKNLKDLRKHIGLVFQFPEYQLFEYTVLKDVMFGPKNFGLSDDVAMKNAKEALSLVGIGPELYEQNPFNLSGGQMRKVSLAGIFAIKPDVLVLDEPTVGLDPLGKTNLMELLSKIRKETHQSIIVISHDMDIVGKYADRIMVMDQGVLKYDGSPKDLFNDFDKLTEYHLDLPNASKLAKSLKEEGLIDYQDIPLTIEELENVILGGHHE